MNKTQNPLAERQADTLRIVHHSAASSLTAAKIRFMIKGLLLLAAVTWVVRYFDEKEYFVGDQSNNHTERKWRSFYRFADYEHKNADIVVFGNSHASSGVEPYIVSMLTGSYCFILNSPGSSVIDAYLNLKEILAHQNKPRLVILETACINGAETGQEWGRIQSFEAKHNSWNKLEAMFYLFKPDEWVKAWSPTIRNHGFLLTDPARISFNRKNEGRIKNPDKLRFDLGRFSHGQTPLHDTTLAKYKKWGPPFKCSNHSISESNINYLNKLYNLCRQNGIELLLFTAPMYYKTFDNYPMLKEQNLEAFQFMKGVQWFDLQEQYDHQLYTPEAFNNEYSGAQHNTYLGMRYNAYKLSAYLLEHYSHLLPKRYNEMEWIRDFSQDDLEFAIHHEIVPGMRNYHVITRNQDVGKFTIKEMAVKEDRNIRVMLLKVKNNPGLRGSLRAHIEIEHKGHRAVVMAVLLARKDILPPGYRVYMASMPKKINCLGVREIE